MQLSRYIVPLDYLAVVSHLLLVLRLFGAALLVPCGVALFYGESSLALLFGGLAAVIYLIGRLKVSSWPPDLEIREALVVTALTYLLYPLLGALAFLPAAPYLDGFFEAMSGFTTTGLSVLRVEDLPRSLLFFRAYSQWLGGAGIIILSLVVLLGPGRAAFQLYASEFGRENLRGSVIATSRVVAIIYLGLTLLGLLVLLGLGMEPFDALLHIMSTLSTGGFSSQPESIGGFHDQALAIQSTFIVFMLLGSISFPLYYLAWREGVSRIWRDAQVRLLLGLVAAAALLFTWLHAWQWNRFHWWLFEATSALTTTGFNVQSSSNWPAGMQFTALFLMTIGGMAGSTAGGLKLFRLIIMAKLAHRMILQVLLPPETRMSTRLGGVAVSETEFREIFGFVIWYFLLLSATTLLLVLNGFEVLESLFESASALGTVGLTAGITSPELAPGLKLALILNMWAGRLEILPLLVVLYPKLWLRGRS